MRAGGRSAAGDEGVGWVAWGRGRVIVDVLMCVCLGMGYYYNYQRISNV